MSGKLKSVFLGLLFALIAAPAIAAETGTDTGVGNGIDPGHCRYNSNSHVCRVEGESTPVTRSVSSTGGVILNLVLTTSGVILQ